MLAAPDQSPPGCGMRVDFNARARPPRLGRFFAWVIAVWANA
jgi:hypothetical protein